MDVDNLRKLLKRRKALAESLEHHEKVGVLHEQAIARETALMASLDRAIAALRAEGEAETK